MTLLLVQMKLNPFRNLLTAGERLWGRADISQRNLFLSLDMSDVSCLWFLELFSATQGCITAAVTSYNG